MKSFREALADVERRRKTVEVHSSEPKDGVAAQFSTRNVSVVHEPLPPTDGPAFVIVRDADGNFLRSMGIDAFDAVLSPEIRPPWVLAETETEYDEVFDFLDGTVFSSYDRRQMLATAREIEERAWRHAAGTLYTGFQDVAALRDQRDVYETLESRDGLTVHLYVHADWDVDVGRELALTSTSAGEIGAFWFVLYDGGGNAIDKCGLLAEERDPGRYYGFWTYDPQLVDDLIAYLVDRY